MSKAEDRYLEHFQDGRLRDCSSKESFLLGYHQAEKDSELTWEDIRKIVIIYENVLNDRDFNTLPIKDGYTEVLKQFKDLKK